MVGGEEWGRVTGEGEENFVEHDCSGLQSVSRYSSSRSGHRLRARSLSRLKLIDEILCYQNEGAEELKAAH